jgi:putative heme-binding domain-containing protein
MDRIIIQSRSMFVCNMMFAMRLSLVIILAAGALSAQHSYTPADIEDGGRLYRATCLTCHGPDGNALPKADLSRGKFRRTSTPAGTESELVTIIEKGIPGTAMPPNESINDFQAATIVAYLRSLTDNPARASALAGDPERGKQLFENKGGCLSCHRVRTTGSRLGPDLTSIGANRRGVEIEHAIVEPNAQAAPQNRMVRVVTKDGSTVTGRLLNIDTFSIGLLDANENLRSFDRAELRESAVVDKSTMPSYKDKLSARELADLVSYLASLRGSEPRP